MGKITLVVCDVKPCMRPAEREFEVNGEKLYVCGENCFLKFWSREYGSWKGSPYIMKASYFPVCQSDDPQVAGINAEVAGSHALHLVKHH